MEDPRGGSVDEKGENCPGPTLGLPSSKGSGRGPPRERTTPAMGESWTAEQTAYQPELEVSPTRASGGEEDSRKQAAGFLTVFSC